MLAGRARSAPSRSNTRTTRAPPYLPGKKGEATEFRFLRMDWFNEIASKRVT